MNASPLPVTERLRISPGPALLRDAGAPPDNLIAHRGRHGTPLHLDVEALASLAEAAGVRGRGGAGFPFARKLRTAAQHAHVGRRPVVVVNASEGEPASAKDAALSRVAPHLVLDGAVTAARALGAREVHVVVPEDRPLARAQLATAVAERGDARVDWRVHVAPPRFVAGQARAVLELLAGRPGLPVTSWQPEAIRGHRRRPTLLSNAETWAHVGLLATEGLAATLGRGTVAEPGTTLLTVHGPAATPHVVEVEHGTPLGTVLGTVLGTLLPAGTLGGPVLLGGFHGTWAGPEAVATARVSASGLREQGLALGAGVVIALGDDECPVELTARIVTHLAAQSAGRCGPCFNGLPALARAVTDLAAGHRGARGDVERLSGLVAGRGACAHPDGTTRLVASLMTALPAEVGAHERRACLVGTCRTEWAS